VANAADQVKGARDHRRAPVHQFLSPRGGGRCGASSPANQLLQALGVPFARLEPFGCSSLCSFGIASQCVGSSATGSRGTKGRVRIRLAFA